MKKSNTRLFLLPMALFALATIFILSAGFAEENHGQKTNQATVHLWDYCDPASFNAALGSGTCNRDTTTGAITVTGFLGEVTSDKSAGAWRFSPAEIESKHGKIALTLQNVRGETHTYKGEKVWRWFRRRSKPGFREPSARTRVRSGEWSSHAAGTGRG